MRRTFTWVALVLTIAIAIVALRARKKDATTKVAASATIAPPLAEPPALVLVKTTKKARELRRGDVEVIGAVKDISGGVVGGATVTVVASSDTTTVGEVVQSDAAGAIHAWVDAGDIRATATADGYTGASWSGVAPGQRIELVLTPESVLQGRVVEAGTATPVAGVLVVADSQDDDVSAKGVTDAEGHFRIRGLSPGHYKPEAVAPNRWGTARASVLLGIAETVSDVVIEVHPSLAVGGRVLRGDTGCPGATVELTADGVARNAEADGDGNIQLEGLFSGTYEVIVRCTGGVEATYPPIVVKDVPITGLVWKTETGFTVRGTLFDDRGRTVAGANVSARKDGDEASAETAPDGAFAIHTLRGGSYELLAARANVFSGAVLDTVIVDHDVEGMRLTLPRSGALRGSVNDDRGAPVPGVSVQIDGDNVPGHAEGTVRDDGTFALEGLLPGPYRMTVLRRARLLRFPGIGDDVAQWKPVTITKGGTAVVKLVVEGERGWIRGRVVDAAGHPLGDVFVEAERQPDPPDAPAKEPRRSLRANFSGEAQVVVEPDGRFTIGKLAPGTYGVRAFRRGGGDAILNDVLPGSDVTLVFKEEATISGTLAGKRPDRFTVGLTDRDGRFSRVESFFRTDGAFTIRDLPEGSYDLVAEAAEGSGSLEVTLAPGQRRDDLAVTLLPHGSIRGRVVAADDGKPIEDLMILVAMDEARRSASPDHATTDADGRFELGRVGSGPVTVVIMGHGKHEAWATHEEKVIVPVSGSVDLPVIRLSRSPSGEALPP